MIFFDIFDICKPPPIKAFNLNQKSSAIRIQIPD